MASEKATEYGLSTELQFIDTQNVWGWIKKEIKVGKSPAGIYLDENLNKLFVANREDDNISVIDTRNFKSIKNIQVGKAPFGII